MQMVLCLSVASTPVSDDAVYIHAHMPGHTVTRHGTFMLTGILIPTWHTVIAMKGAPVSAFSEAELADSGQAAQCLSAAPLQHSSRLAASSAAVPVGPAWLSDCPGTALTPTGH